MLVLDYYNNEVDFDSAMNLANTDLVEELHLKLAPCSEQAFFDAYAAAHEECYGGDFPPYVNGSW